MDTLTKEILQLISRSTIHSLTEVEVAWVILGSIDEVVKLATVTSKAGKSLSGAAKLIEQYKLNNL